MGTLRSRLLLAGVVAGMMSGCSLAPTARPIEPVSTMPDSFHNGAVDSGGSHVRWWEGFNDDNLNGIVDSVLARNLDLRVAAARVRELQQRFRVAQAPLLPSVSARVSRSDSDTPTNIGATGNIGANIPGFPDRFRTTNYEASLGFSYELDFWGRLRGTRSAALGEFVASKADFETVRIGIISESIANYYELANLERRVALSREGVDLLAERLELTRERYDRGLVSSFELYAIQQNFETVRSNLPLLESAFHESKGRLSILLGRFRLEGNMPSFAAGFETFSLAQIPAGLPSDLLVQRPDLIAQTARLESARQRVGVAKASLLPRLSLTGAGGTQSSDLEDLLETDQNFWNLITAITAPIFNAGALRAELGASWARYDQATSTFAKTVLTAFKEVDSALKSHKDQRDRYDFFLAELVAARESREAQEHRYVRGVGDYLAYVDARVNELRVEQNVVNAKFDLARSKLAVHRALGGGWLED